MVKSNYTAPCGARAASIFFSKSDWAPFHITSPLSLISSLHLTVNGRSEKHLHNRAEITDQHFWGLSDIHFALHASHMQPFTHRAAQNNLIACPR